MEIGQLNKMIAFKGRRKAPNGDLNVLEDWDTDRLTDTKGSQRKRRDISPDRIPFSAIASS